MNEETAAIWSIVADVDRALDSMTGDWCDWSPPSSVVSGDILATPQPETETTNLPVSKPASPARVGGKAEPEPELGTEVESESESEAEVARVTWQSLGKPRLLLLLHDGDFVRRVWLTAGGNSGHDRIKSPVDSSEFSQTVGPPSSRSNDEFSWDTQPDSLIPDPILQDLLRCQADDDLLILGDDLVRALPLPLLPVQVQGRQECLVALAAVSVLPSLSWAARVQHRKHEEHSDCCCRQTRVSSYLSSTAIDQEPRWNAYLERAGEHHTLHSLAQLNLVAGTQLLVIASHATSTDDGSVDLRGFADETVTPERIAQLQLPPVVVILGCRTATSNPRAPLHLAEAAILAGANHVIGASTPISSSTGEEIALEFMDLLTRSTHISPAQALQSAMQAHLRAHPNQAGELQDWSLIHIGLPGTACTVTNG